MYQYLMPIVSGPSIRKKCWQEDFHRKNSFWLDEFEPHSGRYQFLRLESAQDFDIKPAEPCPYLEETVGAVNWEWWPERVDFEDRQYMVLSWLSFSNGVILDTRNGERFSFIKKLSYPLVDITSTYGFEQGQVFLDEVGIRYSRDLYDLVKDKLGGIGLHADFDDRYTTGRNELYTRTPLDRDKFSGQTLRFWGFDMNLVSGEDWRRFLMD